MWHSGFRLLAIQDFFGSQKKFPSGELRSKQVPFLRNSFMQSVFCHFQQGNRKISRMMPIGIRITINLLLIPLNILRRIAFSCTLSRQPINVPKRVRTTTMLPIKPGAFCLIILCLFADTLVEAVMINCPLAKQKHLHAFWFPFIIFPLNQKDRTFAQRQKKKPSLWPG